MNQFLKTKKEDKIPVKNKSKTIGFFEKVYKFFVNSGHMSQWD